MRKGADRMRVLIDTNIAFTYVTGRPDPYAAEVDRIMQLCAEEKIEGISGISFSFDNLVFDTESA